MNTNRSRFAFDSPAVYQIHIDGSVSARWAEAVGVSAVSTKHAPGNRLTTRLTGEVTDQAALMGILNELYEMHCTVLEVRRLSESYTSGPAPSPPLASDPPDA